MGNDDYEIGLTTEHADNSVWYAAECGAKAQLVLRSDMDREQAMKEIDDLKILVGQHFDSVDSYLGISI